MSIKIFDDEPAKKPPINIFAESGEPKTPAKPEPVLPAVSAETPVDISEPIVEKKNNSFFDDSHSLAKKLNEKTLNEVSNEVIDTINREFPLSVLRQPEDEDRKKVKERIGVLVTQSMRKRQLTPGVAYENSLTDEHTRRLMGFGFLDLLLPPARNDITEISIYSSGLVQVMKKGAVEFETIDVHPSPEEIERVLDRLLGVQNKTLNETNPTVRAKLPRTKHNPGGGRIQALHKCIAPPGQNAAITIRLFEGKPVRPEWILERFEMSPEMMDTLKQAMSRGKRILITGGTGTGKTTLLSAICNFLPQNWRIVKIEDPEELWIDRPTVQTIEVRPQALGTEVASYTLANGVDDAMRMTPNYLILGEVRDGIAALALFRAFMTGHAGACTLHADSPKEAVKRVAVLLSADAHVGRGDANQLFADSIDLHVQIRIRFKHKRRLVTSISAVHDELKGGEVWFDPLWEYDYAKSTPNREVWNKIADLKFEEDEDEEGE